MDNRTSQILEVTVTNQCNCRCDYCFECSHENTSTREEEDRQVALVDRYCREFDLERHDLLKLTFWGGEPMANTEFLFRLLETTRRYPFVRYSMYSNGTMPKAFEEMARLPYFGDVARRMDVQLSYDGEPIHSIKRHYGPSLVFKTADLLLSLGVAVSFKATLPFDQIGHLSEVWDSYLELNDRYPFAEYGPTLDQTNANNVDEAFELWKEQLSLVAAKEVRFILSHGYPLWSWFNAPGKLACSMNDTVHMHNDGHFYVCHGAPYLDCKESFRTGSTLDGKPLDEVVNSGFMPTLRMPECVACPAVACQVCHVAEIARSMPGKESEYRENWTRAMVNNGDRCRFFRYFGKIYHATRLATLRRRLGD